jgi:hypothetical protein
VTDHIVANDPKMGLVRCLGPVRWVPRSMLQAGDYKLQQLFEVIEHTKGNVSVRREEWCDIPFIQELS